MAAQSKHPGEPQRTARRTERTFTPPQPHPRSPIDSAVIRTLQLNFQVDAGEDSLEETTWQPFPKLKKRNALLFGAFDSDPEAAKPPEQREHDEHAEAASAKPGVPAERASANTGAPGETSKASSTAPTYPDKRSDNAGRLGQK